MVFIINNNWGAGIKVGGLVNLFGCLEGVFRCGGDDMIHSVPLAIGRLEAICTHN